MHVKPLVVQSEAVDIKLLVDHGLHLLVPEDVGGVHVVELLGVRAASLYQVTPRDITRTSNVNTAQGQIFWEIKQSEAID